MSSIPKEMRAAVTYGPEDVKIEKIPVPEYEPDQILVKVAACGICGTDIHILSGHMRPMWPPFYPFIQGHEWGGEVAAIGSAAKTGLQVGDRVIMEPTIGCGVCGMCRRGSYHLCEETGKPGGGYKLLGHTANGAYSEYGVAPPTNLHRLPESMGWKEAVIVNQVVIALHAIERGGGVQPADKVAVVGPGLLGLSVLQLVRAFGAARTYIAGRGYRLDIARALGADVAIDVTKDDPVKVVMEDTSGRGADFVIECAGPPEAMESAVAMARRGGRVVLEGISGGKNISLLSDRIVLDEITIFGGRGSPNCYPRAIELMAAGHIDAGKMLTHTFTLDQFDAAFALVRERGDGVMRAMITP